MDPTGARLVVDALVTEGVEVVFTLCGGHICPIYDACLDSGIRIVDFRHEQAAVMAADAYARLTGRLGVALVTAGPGVTNAVTGVANAKEAGSPVLCIGGRSPFALTGLGALQEMEQVALMRPVAKWAAACNDPNRAYDFTATAIRHAMSGAQGPAFLELPVDVLMLPAPFATRQSRSRSYDRPAPDPDAVDAAAMLLRTAERPVVLGGSGVWTDRAYDALRAFAEATNVPVFLNAAGRGCLPSDHPNNLSFGRKRALAEADVLLVLGAPLDFRLGYGRSPVFGGGRTIVCDTDQHQIGANRDCDVGITGHLARTIPALIDALATTGGYQAPQAWMDTLRADEAQGRARLERDMASDSRPIHPLRFAAELARHLDDDTILVGDGGDILALSAKLLRPRKPGLWLDPGRLGTLGVGAPFAIAARIAFPNRRVVVLSGDGSFGFNGFEFETAVRLGLSMVVAVGNDAAWGQIRTPQREMFGADRAPATSLSPACRYDKVVEAFGGRGERVDDPRELGPGLERAFASGTVYALDVRIDPSANTASAGKGMAI